MNFNGEIIMNQNSEELIQRKERIGRKLMKRSLPLENTIVFGADSPRIKGKAHGKLKFDENGMLV